MITQTEIDEAVATAMACRPTQEIEQYGVAAGDLALALMPAAGSAAVQIGRVPAPMAIVTAMVRAVLVGMELERATSGTVVVLAGDDRGDAAKLAAYTDTRGWLPGEDAA